MKRWTVRIVGLIVLGYTCLWGYSSYQRGLFSLPDLPDGAYTLSFDNGFRAIVLDAEIADRTMHSAPKYLRSLAIANRDRKYLSLPFEVQPWFKDAWSWCKTPTPEEQAQLEQMPDDVKRSIENARFEGICRIDVDGKEIVRGLIFSVPRL